MTTTTLRRQEETNKEYDDDDEEEEEREKMDFLATIQQNNGRALKYVSRHLQEDKDFILAAMSRNGYALQHVSVAWKEDPDIVLAAVTEDGSALKFASSPLRANREIVKAAVMNYGLILQWASEDLQADREIVLAAVTQDGLALLYASKDLQADRQIALLAVTNTWEALPLAAQPLRDDKEIVQAAVKQDGDAFEYASTNLQSDKEFVRTVVTLNGRALRYASEFLKADKDIVSAAVANEPEALKFALGGLNQDPDCWKAAQLWCDTHHRHDAIRNHEDSPSIPTAEGEQDCGVKIVLSTKFSLTEQSLSIATNFTAVLNQTLYFRDNPDRQFVIYSPNAFGKGTCDPNWTNMEWPCRGTYQTCCQDPALKTGVPKDNCCWRYSYRYHLEVAKRTNGCMIQVVDHDDWDAQKHVLGKGQELETIMAQQVGTKIFRVCQPIYVYDDAHAFGKDFTQMHMKQVVHQIKQWYTTNHDCPNNNNNMAICEIKFYRRRGKDWNTSVRFLDQGDLTVDRIL